MPTTEIIIRFYTSEQLKTCFFAENRIQGKGSYFAACCISTFHLTKKFEKKFIRLYYNYVTEDIHNKKNRNW